MPGWIKLHRCLLEKPIWACATPVQRNILITILLLANHAEREWEWKGQRYKCSPGQLITSLPSLAKKCDCSIQNIRTALKRFATYDFLTDEPTAQGRLITVVNWGRYQIIEPDLTVPLTDSQQTANRQLTSNNNDKNVKNDKKYIIPYGDIVSYLNEKTGKSFKSSAKATQSHISARYKEGFTVDDFYKVIDIKVAEWKDDPAMEQFLRPVTLFSTKFESYLNQKPSKPKDKPHDDEYSIFIPDDRKVLVT